MTRTERARIERQTKQGNAATNLLQLLEAVVYVQDFLLREEGAEFVLLELLCGGGSSRVSGDDQNGSLGWSRVLG